MELSTCSEYIKRTQKDYTMTFNIHVVSEIEQGILTKSEAKKRYGIQGSGTISKWLEKFGNFDWENKDPLAMIVVSMVKNVRKDMPKIGTLKLYHILHDQLKEIRVGRDKLFAIIKANHLDIIPQRSYCVTTNSHLHFKKHRIKLKVFQ